MKTKVTTESFTPAFWDLLDCKQTSRLVMSICVVQNLHLQSDTRFMLGQVLPQRAMPESEWQETQRKANTFCKAL